MKESKNPKFQLKGRKFKTAWSLGNSLYS